MSTVYRRLGLLAAAAVTVLVVTGCATAPFTGRRQLTLVDNQQMLQMSLQEYQQTLQNAEVVASGPQVEQLRRVGNRIAGAVDRYVRDRGLKDSFAWEFNLIKADDTVNAWAMPGGKIAFYTGILPVCRDDDGIAVVMAHEIGHVLAHHGNERFSQAMVAQLGLATLGAALSEKPEQTRALWLAAAGLGVQYGVLMPYGRTQEYEADHIGAIVMAMAGYDPRAALDFWQRMAAQGGGSPPEFLSTHPSDSNRIAQLRQLMPDALKYYQPQASLTPRATPVAKVGVR